MGRSLLSEEGQELMAHISIGWIAKIWDWIKNFISMPSRLKALEERKNQSLVEICPNCPDQVKMKIYHTSVNTSGHSQRWHRCPTCNLEIKLVYEYR
jgi:hypothetical protein